MYLDASDFQTVEKLMELLIVVEIFNLGFNFYTLFRNRITNLIK